MSTHTRPKKNRGSLNLRMGVVGLIACIIGIGALLVGTGWLAGLAAMVIVVSLATMYFTRKSDEYTLSLWSSATNAAFALILVLMFAAPALEGFYDGLTGNEGGQDYPSDASAVASILTFYLTFNIKRLTGAF